MKHKIKISSDGYEAVIINALGKPLACPYSAPIPQEIPGGLIGAPGKMTFAKMACSSDCPLFEIHETTDYIKNLKTGDVVTVGTCQKKMDLECS